MEVKYRILEPKQLEPKGLEPKGCSGVGAVCVTSPEPSFACPVSVDGFPLHAVPAVLSVVVCITGLLACFCHKLTFNHTGGFDHRVFDTFVQLTEGRSARDQPKQPPAKKILVA